MKISAFGPTIYAALRDSSADIDRGFSYDGCWIFRILRASMHIATSPIEPDTTFPVVVNLQGGAALCAFGAGSLTRLLEEPRIKIVGISGTSMGALEAAFVTDGLVNGGNRLAKERLKQLWDNLAEFQDGSLPLWFHAAETVHRSMQPFFAASEAMAMTLGGFHPWFKAYADATIGSVDLAQRAFRDAQSLMLGGGQQSLSSHPILGFLDHMANKSLGLDFSALKTTDILVINSTAVPAGSSPWLSRASDSHAYRGAAITRTTLAASGTLSGIMPAIMVNGQQHFDGGYSANPLIYHPEMFGADAGTSCILIRSRTAYAHQLSSPLQPITPEQERSFFNMLTDRDWRSFEQTREGQGRFNNYVIEPSSGSQRDTRLMVPEVDFNQSAIAARFKAGARAANELVSTLLNEQASLPSARAAALVEAHRAAVA